MRHVAEHVGMSMMTVSRVLNNESSVKPATREKVMNAVQELGYRPNISARNLAAAQSYFLGLIYDNPSAAYMSELLLGALERCNQKGYHLVVQSCGPEAATWADELTKRLTGSHLDGVIVPPPVCDDPKVLEALRRFDMPYVCISPNSQLPDTPVVYMDDRQAAYQMTQHLLEQGHRDIGFILGHPNQESSRLRYQGFSQALGDAGIRIDELRVVQGFYSYKSGFAAAERLLSDTHRPTAIFASNDDMAAAVYANAQRYNLRIPDDLSVVGFDDTPTASIIYPALTTIRQPIAEMAGAALDMLSELIKKKKDPDFEPELRHKLDFELIQRDSVARK
ncbi:LacI family DNA-binding transcriptional regulator [Acanthopleuribacter pedis]|uniref:LacI family DNA-binding transcriptional regulator n=1 Tax=Acanthopleuribacter pedis TaxID=442870 RepID=A0A8J7QJA0_9BACT|nr:LacI family DNA-binding transcriptional regulator [Acanthopleuribacter pedis]MBO1323445.1 LacI family DNA-binding transcriptional regulator [Acanthopleuribacter pedis]